MKVRVFSLLRVGWLGIVLGTAGVGTVEGRAGVGGVVPPEPSGPVYAVHPARTEPRTLHFAVNPMQNPAQLNETFYPLMVYLNAGQSEATFELETSRDYKGFEDRVRHRVPEVIQANPWQALQAIAAGYEVIAMAGDPVDFRGIILVRRDRRINQLRDLKHQSVAYPAPTALAACVMAQWEMHRAGLDVNQDLVNLYVGSQDSAIMNVYLGKTAAGVTWMQPWRSFQREHPLDAAQLKVLMETPHLVNNAVMARRDLPESIKQDLRTLLLGMGATAPGRSTLAQLGIRRFHPAADTDYDVVRDYVRRFEAEVRIIEP